MTLHLLLKYDSDTVYSNPGFQFLLQLHSKSKVNLPLINLLISISNTTAMKPSMPQATFVNAMTCGKQQHSFTKFFEILPLSEASLAEAKNKGRK